MEEIDGGCSSSAAVTSVNDSPSSASALSIFLFQVVEL